MRPSGMSTTPAVVMLVVLAVALVAGKEGDTCFHRKAKRGGTCRQLSDCTTTTQRQQCAFKRGDSVPTVCCPSDGRRGGGGGGVRGGEEARGHRKEHVPAVRALHVRQQARHLPLRRDHLRGLLRVAEQDRPADRGWPRGPRQGVPAHGDAGLRREGQHPVPVRRHRHLAALRAHGRALRLQRHLARQVGGAGGAPAHREAPRGRAAAAHRRGRAHQAPRVQAALQVPRHRAAAPGQGRRLRGGLRAARLPQRRARRREQAQEGHRHGLGAHGVGRRAEQRAHDRQPGHDAAGRLQEGLRQDRQRHPAGHPGQPRLRRLAGPGLVRGRLRRPAAALPHRPVLHVPRGGRRVLRPVLRLQHARRLHPRVALPALDRGHRVAPLVATRPRGWSIRRAVTAVALSLSHSRLGPQGGERDRATLRPYLAHSTACQESERVSYFC